MREFVEKNFKHFNAGSLANASRDYVNHIDNGGVMFLTLAGAMSTAEIGISLAEMIRQEKVHAICSTGANLEEDLFNSVSHDHYVKITRYRDLTPDDEMKLFKDNMNRVTDTCIPEDEAMRVVESYILKYWLEASKNKDAYSPHEYLYKIILETDIVSKFQTPRENSWLLAAAERNLPLFIPGWEDSTLGNFLVSHVINSNFDIMCIKSGLSYMQELIQWYSNNIIDNDIGFFK